MTEMQRQVILTQAEQITRSLTANNETRAESEVDCITLAGLGGSGHPGDLLNSLSLPTLPLYVHRNYELPLEYLAHLGLKRPLVIASSYSGNTEETLTAYRAARAAGLPLLVSCSGGTLAAWAERDSVPLCRINFPGMQPRHTLLAAFTGIYCALRNSRLADNIDAELTRAAGTLARTTPELEEPARSLAAQIKDKIPIFTATDNLGFAAKNFKIQTNENAKYPAFWNTFPELNHNELVGFSQLQETHNPNRFIAVFLHDETDHPRNKARLQVTADLYQQWGIETAHFTARGVSPLEKIFTTVTFGLWTTFYLAEELGIDPIPVEDVESFKKKLEQIAGPL